MIRPTIRLVAPCLAGAVPAAAPLAAQNTAVPDPPEMRASALTALALRDAGYTVKTNVAANFRREPVPQDTRIHCVITNGARAPALDHRR